MCVAAAATGTAVSCDCGTHGISYTHSRSPRILSFTLNRIPFSFTFRIVLCGCAKRKKNPIEFLTYYTRRAHSHTYDIDHSPCRCPCPEGVSRRSIAPITTREGRYERTLAWHVTRRSRVLLAHKEHNAHNQLMWLAATAAACTTCNVCNTIAYRPHLPGLGGW